MRTVLHALLGLLLLCPTVGWACDVIESDLYRVNRNAVVEQPAPPPIMSVTAAATISPAVSGGCSEDACPDASAVFFTMALDPADAGRFGYDIELLEPSEHAPFISGALAPLDPDDPYEIAILWGSNAQYQATPFQVRLRTINLKGEPGPWSQPVTVTPAPLAGQPAGFGLGSLLFVLLLGHGWTRRRRVG